MPGRVDTAASPTSNEAQPEEAVVLQVDKVETDLVRIAKLIDEIKTGSEARELHDFVQDELLPVVKLLASDIKSIAMIVMEHDEALAEMSEEDSSGTQILAEHAAELIEHLTETNNLLQQLFEQSKMAGTPLTPLEARIEKGRALIEFVQSVTVEEEQEEEGTAQPN